nr:DUF4238 domain-containing protein [Cryobacterium sp. SO1]
MRHHTVPRFYLAGFAEGKRLRAIDIATAKSFDTNTSDATIENHFYSIPNHPTNPSIFEDELAQVESEAAVILAAARRGEWPLNSDDRLVFAEFMTLQHLRGQDHRLQLHHVLATILRRLAEQDPTEFERIAKLPGAPAGLSTSTSELPPLASSASHIQQIVTLLPQLMRFFLERTWTLVKFESPSLLTSDAPITPVPHPNSDQSVGLGLENARAMLFPLTRHAGLIMQSAGTLESLAGLTDDIEAGRFDQVMPGDEVSRRMFNNNTVMHAHQRVYHHPDDGQLVPDDVTALSARGGRIDFENPPAGLRPAR